jgi:hypothetical protein
MVRSSPVERMRRYGAEVAYTLNTASAVRFTIAKVEPGRTSSGRCVRLTKANYSARRRTRMVSRPGDFTRTGRVGDNRFRSPAALPVMSCRSTVTSSLPRQRTAARLDIRQLLHSAS